MANQKNTHSYGAAKDGSAIRVHLPLPQSATVTASHVHLPEQPVRSVPLQSPVPAARPWPKLPLQPLQQETPIISPQRRAEAERQELAAHGVLQPRRYTAPATAPRPRPLITDEDRKNAPVVPLFKN